VRLAISWLVGIVARAWRRRHAVHGWSVVGHLEKSRKYDGLGRGGCSKKVRKRCCDTVWEEVGALFDGADRQTQRWRKMVHKCC